MIYSGILTIKFGNNQNINKYFYYEICLIKKMFVNLQQF